MVAGEAASAALIGQHMQDEIEAQSLSRRAEAALLALDGRPRTAENVGALTQRQLRFLPGVGSVTLKEIMGWAHATGWICSEID